MTTFTFHTQQSDLRHLNAMNCEVIRQLGADEADEEVGPMFKVRFADGTAIDAFEDELTAVPSNLEAAAATYAEKMQRAYVEKRGGSAPVSVALNVYLWAFNRFIANPDQCAA